MPGHCCLSRHCLSGNCCYCLLQNRCDTADNWEAEQELHARILCARKLLLIQALFIQALLIQALLIQALLIQSLLARVLLMLAQCRQ